MQRPHGRSDHPGVRFLFLFLSWAIAGCHTVPGNASSHRTPPASWLEWQAERRESVAGTNGWMTLAGLHWLADGASEAGSASTHPVVLPRHRAADHVGTFTRTGRLVRFDAAGGVIARLDGNVIQSAELRSDRHPPASLLAIGPLTFTVIERGERVGLRVRDPEAPARRRFTGLKYFPYDPAWRMEGRFEPFPEPRRLRVPDVTGSTQEFVSRGALVFLHGGRSLRLVTAEEPGAADLFVLFRDETAGRSTYPAGRFLYVPRPDERGRVVIDFNRAYTPPCGFTAFATCPLPPEENFLPFPIRAGERTPQGGRAVH